MLKENKTGFTLIEFIIYLAIVSLVLGASFTFGWQIIYGNTKSQAIREVQQNTRLALEKISQALLAANAVNSPGLGSSSNSLSLTMADLNKNPTVFQIINNRLTVSQGGLSLQDITNARVKITNLQFINLSFSGKPEIIKVQITVEHLNPENLNQYQASFSAETSVSLRE